MHTPGPYQECFEGNSIIVSGGPNNDDIAEFFYRDEATVSISRKEAESNARLLIASLQFHENNSVTHLRVTENDGSQWVNAEAYDNLLNALQKIAGGFISTNFVMSSPPDWHNAFNQLQKIADLALTEIAMP